jgi:selenocysteine-specific translation elongation factor|tara:strand:+ start:5279 stop:6265 length:987 start_codon:yes stop_codon:yes gene_type:complete
VPVLNIAFVGSENLARSIAKKGDVRDIESYVFKEEKNGVNQILSLLRPLKHPEKIRPLLSVLNVAKVGIIEVSKIDASLGEICVAFGCAEIKKGMVIINPETGGWVDSDQVKMIMHQSGLKDWELYETVPDEHNIREKLFSLMGEVKENNDSLILPVDQHFNVKGVGLVAIGYVQSGSVSKHDTIQVLPVGENGIVRSLQVMDDDVDIAISGDRVGLAIRNLREEALHRGCMIIHSDSDALVKNTSSIFEIKMAPFQKRSLEVGDVIHAAVDMQFIVGRIKSKDDSTVSVEWEIPLWTRLRDSPPIIITQLDATPMRIIGTAILQKSA